MHTVKVSSKGWVVIPKELREKHNVEPGTHVQIVEYGEVLALVPLPKDPVDALHGMLTEGPSLTSDLLAMREQDRAQEEAEDA
ncbi:MAG: AbrB/MazE/SpoVT family DNA-binding domain-containing protein [Anaerolineae bacterium]